MANNRFFIIYAIKDNTIYYVANTNPIIWTGDIRQSKIFFNRYSAEYSILRDYDNYRYMSSQIESNIIDVLYVGEYINGNEVERGKLL